MALGYLSAMASTSPLYAKEISVSVLENLNNYKAYSTILSRVVDKVDKWQKL